MAFNLGPAQSYAVPVGQRLVIEYVSGLCQPKLSGTGIFTIYTNVAITVTTGGMSLVHRLALPINPISFPTGSSMDETVPPQLLNIGHLVKIYADAGTSVTIPNTSFCFLTFSGQLV